MAAPAPFPHRMPRLWWLKRGSYLVYMLRELSVAFVAVFLLGMLCLINAAAAGGDAYGRVLGAMAHPCWIAFHAVALAFAVLHTVTWFKAGAVIMPVKGVPTWALIAGNLAAWVAVSAALLYAFVRFG